MIVWRGLGFLVVVAAMVGIFVGKYIQQQFFGSFTTLPNLGLCIGLWLGAGLLYGIDRLIQRANPPRAFIDKESGREIIAQARHDLFYISMKYWTFIFMAGGLLLLFASRKA